MMNETPQENDRNGFSRRGFLAGVAGGAALLIPLLSGILVFLDPLRRKTRASEFIRVTMIDSVPDDGLARPFPVLADRTDAWSRYPEEPIGAVYLRREKGRTEVQAFNAICPHAGCFVDFNMKAGEFQCPCHDSRFLADGSRIDPDASPSPRDLDRLNVDPTRLDGGEVWVEFKNFQSGTPERIVR